MCALGVAWLVMAGLARAHMSLWFPGPLGGAIEANSASTAMTVDPELNFPFGCCDSQGKATLPQPKPVSAGTGNTPAREAISHE